MRGTPHPLVAIGQVVGVSDQSHCTSTVRCETGVTPARFRLAAA